MRKLFSVFVPGVLLVGYIYTLGIPIETPGGTLPPLGKFFNPFSGFWKNADPVEISGLESLTMNDLKHPVSVFYDERLVPHIFAESESDLVMVQGYLHAKYRLWQMDITARQTAGRLAEVFGENLLASDKRMRRMGLANAARSYSESWKKCDEYAFLTDYVKGINQYISQLTYADYPFEFKLFDYKPELWSIEKTALVVMNMNLMLCSRNEDLMATNALNFLGKDKFNDLFPRSNPKQTPVIPGETLWNFDGEISKESRSTIGYFKDQFINESPRSVGSNNWAVAGTKTTDGHAMLCNDPHLSLTLPSIWYELQMKTNTYNAYGVSLPGLPYLAIGFNENIAWGETNVGMDVSDFYEIEWSDSSKTAYKIDNNIVPIKTRIETYQISDGRSITDTIKLSQWGPIFFEENRSLALHWLPNEMTNNCMIGSFRKLNQSENFEDYYQAVLPFTSPAQNFVFASREGSIALKVQGAIPIKPANEGQFVLNGAQSVNKWTGYVPFSETPFIKNPTSGFVSSANQVSTDTSYPYAYHGYYEDFRGRTLHHELSNMSGVTVEKMQDLQNSTYDLLAAELCPLLLRLIKAKSGENKWSSALTGWNYQYDRDRMEPIIFDIWKQHYYDLIWDELKHEEQEQNIKMLYPEMWRTIAMTEKEPDHPFFDITSTTSVENAQDIAMQSLLATSKICDSLFQKQNDLTWKDYRKVRINHLSRVPAFSELEIDIGGVATALNSVKETHGPSWRMVVKLSTPIEAWGVYPGGQSGNPGSPYYKNMITQWAKGSYYKLHFVNKPDELATHQIASLNFTP